MQYICDTPRCATFLDMGLGKTVSTLTAISDLIACQEVKRALVIAPLRVSLNTWPDEIASWPHVSGLTYRVLAGLAPPQRRQALIGKEEIHVINRELLPWLVETLGPYWPYDMVVIDESSSFKSHKSQRWKALRKALPKIERMTLLTGTPIPNGLIDLWAQIALLDGGQRLGRTFSSFRNRYYTSDYMGFSWTLKPGAAEEIYAKISDVCLAMRAEDYLELPPMISNYLRVRLPESARKIYHTLEKDFVALVGDGEEIMAINAAALANKLQQAANGALYDESGLWHGIHDAKLDALEEIVDGTTDPILVAYSYRADVDRILSRFKTAVALDKNPDTIARWNRGEIRMLVAHPVSCGHGLNLQHGGSTLVWFGVPWSLEYYQQMTARLNRQGQTRTTVVHHIVAAGTIDSTIVDALAGKYRTQAALLAAVRDDAKRRIA